MNDPQLKGWPRLRDLVRALSRQSLPLIGVEVGVSQGWTSEALLREFPNLILLGVDFWDSSSADSEYAKSGDSMAKLTGSEQFAKMRHAIERTEFANERRKMIRSDSVAAAYQVPDGWLDFAFIDGDHTLDGVRRDLVAWAPKVREGGIIVGHDFSHPRDRRGLWGVSRAFREFCESRNRFLRGWEKDTICWVNV
jgi:hypothetical protein